MGFSKKQVALISILHFLAGFFLAKEMDRMNPLAKEVTVTASTERTATATASNGGAHVRRTSAAALPVAADDQQTGGCRPTTQFDRILQKAYEDATAAVEDPLPRNKFDINWWENQSNKTTVGGLTRQDRKLLSKLYSNAESVFEYGLGESTYMANYVGVPRYAGIDSDPVWVDMARNEVAKHYRFYFADIGPTGKWGKPTYPKLGKGALNYQLEPLAVEQEPFDVYMVDGRYRLACALACFLHASARGGDPSKTTVLIHDCHKVIGGTPGNLVFEKNPKLTHENRERYHDADHLLDLADHSGNRLCVYQRKPDTTDQQIADMYMKIMKKIN